MVHKYSQEEPETPEASEPAIQYDNHATGCVKQTPVIPRKCSIKEAQSRSMTIDQFTSKLYTMVDVFYSKKA